MTQQEKQLLLIDLCTRLPYGVRVKLNGRRETSNKLTIDWLYTYSRHIEDIKPYLRPMSSMTEEEKETFQGFIYPACNDPVSMINWLNAHHFDYKNLIEKGLALEAPEGMYK